MVFKWTQPTPLGGWETGNMALESFSFHRHHNVVGFDRPDHQQKYAQILA